MLPDHFADTVQRFSKLPKIKAMVLVQQVLELFEDSREDQL